MYFVCDLGYCVVIDVCVVYYGFFGGWLLVVFGVVVV